MSRAIFLLLMLFVSTVSNAQEVVGKYHSAYFDKDFEIRLDCLDRVYADKKIRPSDRARHIYFQVQCDEPNVKAYIQMDPDEALDFVKTLKKNAAKVSKWLAQKGRVQEKSGDGEINHFYFVGEGGNYVQPVVGYESDQDYTILFIKGKKGEPVLQYKGDEANNEGDIKFNIDGWNLILSDFDKEITEIETLISKTIDRKTEIDSQMRQEKKTGNSK